MSNERNQTDPIAVYGATGYTGRLIAAELARSGLDFVLAGRNREKLEAVVTDLGVDVPVHAITTNEGSALRNLFAGCGAVIACAGPFHLHGEPILEAAVATGTHYFDTTGEQPFIQRALDLYGPRAAKAGSAVLSGMGFDYVPGDMLAALTASGLEPLDTLRLAYLTDFQPTRGTMLSALDMIKGGDLEWRDGRLAPAAQSVSRGRFDFGSGVGEQQMTRYPAGEHITVPRHVEVRRIETMLSAGSVLPKPLVPLASLIMRPAGLAMRSPVKALAGRIIGRLPEGASPETRAAATWMIACEATAGARVRRGRITGRDVYGLTAALLVEAAAEAATAGFTGRGGLAPSQAFDPEEFLGRFDRFGVNWSIDPLG